MAPVSGVTTGPLASKSPRRPGIVVAGLLAAALGIGIALVKGNDRASGPRPGPAAERPAEAPALPVLATQPAPAPAPSPEPAPSTPVAAPATKKTAPTARDRSDRSDRSDHRSKARRHAEKPKVDENGIGIPTD